MARSRTFTTAGCLLLLASVAAACGGAGAVETTGTQGAVGGAGSARDTADARSGGSVRTSSPSAPQDTTWPLLGTPSSAGDDRDRPAVVVKVDNDPHARPQAGLNQADLVYEIEVEGVTRFAAVFHSRDVNPVGPIRSARSSDIDAVSNLGVPYFAWSGANPTVTAEVQGAVDQGMLVSLGHDQAPDEYWRDNSRLAPHNLYSDTAGIRDVGEGGSAPHPVFQYRHEGDELPDGAFPVAGVGVDYVGDGRITDVEFVWDAASEGWARFQTDQLHGPGALAHVDAAGEQIAPDNVVILFAHYGVSAAGGSPQAWTVGSGEAIVLTGYGQAIEGTWIRGDRTDDWNLHTAGGGVIRLNEGSTWVLLPRPGHVSYLTPDRAQALLETG